MPTKYRLVVIPIFLLSFFLFSTLAVAAMSLTINDAPGSLDYDKEFEVSINLASAPVNTIYYLRIAFTAPENPAYFGYTQKNDGTWHKYEEEFNNFYEITTSEEGNWNGKIKAKPDHEDKDFKGTGSYILKIGRFTSSGKSHYWSDNELSLNIQGPSPSPTPTLTPGPTSTPTPTPTKTPTATPKPTVKAVVTKKPKIISSKTTSDKEESEILGLREGLEPPSPTPIPESEEKRKIPITAVLFVLGGLGFMGVAGYPFLKSMKKRYNIKNEEETGAEGGFKSGDN
jgi:hypothetical protein